MHGSSQRAQTPRTASSISGRTTATIRSCDSEIMISHGSMPSSRNGTRSRWTSIPASPDGHLRQGGGETGRAAVLQRLDEARLDELERDLDQLLAGERIADLHRRALVGVVLAQLGAREHRGAADAVAAGRRAVEDDHAPGAAGLRRAQPVAVEQPHAHRVDEAVRGVRRVEDGLAADRRHADAVAVVADPGDGLLEVEVRLAEPEPVEERDRPRSHRDHVAQDPADAGRRALERLDGGRMVVRLDLERDRRAVAEIEHAGVLTRPLQNALAGRRQPPEERGGVLVAAVLRPEEREDRELEVVRVAPEQLPDTARLPVGQTEGAVQKGLGGDLRQVIECNHGRGGISRDPSTLRFTR